MQTLWTPKAQSTMIKDKINNIRSHNVLHKSQNSKAAANAINDPKLWYYTSSVFLKISRKAGIHFLVFLTAFFPGCLAAELSWPRPRPLTGGEGGAAGVKR